MSGITCIVIVLLMRVIQQYTNKKSSMLMPTGTYGNTKYFMLLKLFAAVLAGVLLLISREFNKIDGMTVLFAAISGAMLVVATACGLYAIKSGSMALTSIFGTAGLLVPCIAGIFLYDEVMSVMQWGGVALFFASSVLLIGSVRKENGAFSFKTVLLLAGSLVSNGVTMLVQTMFAREVVGGSVTAFSFLSFLIPAVVLLAFMGVLKLKDVAACTEKLDKKLIGIAVLAAAAVFVINQLATMAANLISPVILFTFINGGNTVIAAVMGTALFKEKLTVKSALGIVLGIGALVLVKAFAPA